MYGYARLVMVSLVVWFAAPGVAPAENVKGGEADASPKTPSQAGVAWSADYGQAWRQAKRERKMLFIYFHQPNDEAFDRSFDHYVVLPAMNDNRRARFVFVKLPLDARRTVNGVESRLLSHAAFRHNQNRRGVAIVDLAHPEIPSFEHVVSSFPFRSGRYCSSHALGVILDLPRGTLTQRTMVYAVRIHPEAPRSTHGQFNPQLMQEAQSHSQHQASIGVQGHHNWNSRFHRINARLSSGLLSQEVVSESWGGESLVEAAVECVHSWRQSSGHWSAVSRYQPCYGYDMKCGANGVWYGTGIFGNSGS